MKLKRNQKSNLNKDKNETNNPQAGLGVITIVITFPIIDRKYRYGHHEFKPSIIGVYLIAK